MSGNEIETFQKISDFIDSFDSTSLGSIIILAILVCVVLVSVFKSIYSTSVYEFQRKKQKYVFSIISDTDNINFYKLYVAECSPDFYGDIIRNCQPGGIYSISKKGKWYEKVFRNDR